MQNASAERTSVLCGGDQVTTDDGLWAGGKAVGLAKLAGVDARVPDWEVIGASWFTAHVTRGDAGELYQRLTSADDPADRERIAEKLRSTIVDAPVDAALADAVAAVLIGRGPVAVRSSAVGEDGADRSYAGIYESYLYLTDHGQVLDAVKRCWASAFSPRALHYRTENSDPAAVPEVAVIIQDMIDGDVSGVLFTVDPVSGSTDQALVSACWGLGEGVVNGACAVDEFTVKHDGTEVSARVADKDIEFVRVDDGGVEERDIPADRREVRCLEPEQVRTLVREGVRIASALGGPQDIEWTFRDGQLIVLQTRPITARASAAMPGALGDWRTVWDNSNIQESFNGVTLPLTFSWASKVYEVIFRETLHLIGVRDDVVAANEKVLRNMVGLVSGRVYYNINNWYRVLRMAPFFDRNKDDVERMIGVENPVDFIEGIHASTRERLASVPQLAPVFVVLAWRMANRGKLVDQFQREVGGEVDRIGRDLTEAKDLEQLLELAERGLNLFGRWSVQILNDLYLSNQAGRARRLLAQDGEAASEEIVAGLLASEEAVESLQPTIILMRLAARIRKDEALAEALYTGDARSGYDAVRAASADVTGELDRYIELYGDRCMGEQKLETISLRQDPSFVATILRNYVRDETIDAESFERAHDERQSTFERDVLGALPRLQRERVARVVRKARIGVRDRERMRLTRTRIVGVGRAVYSRIGELLCDAGQLDEPRHVFYLTMDEITAFAEGRSMTADLAAVARARITEFAGYEDTEPPNQFETSGPPYGFSHAAVNPAPGGDGDERVVHGTGCWPGIVEGQVQVVLSPNDDLDVRGKIMTTMRTDPGWGPLFPSVKGLLIERGSTLSHSAVLARELGIPAVVGVPGLMSFIRDGERVRLDGATGRVERLDELD
ncbi:MAG: phosphoenolpyruvate synthase [Rhodococcus sp.]|nr:phosphoenolpyruvate synthase [Rhodococcus sp. (in: high G+C Gram-positive bacteria)]